MLIAAWPGLVTARLRHSRSLDELQGEGLFDLGSVTEATTSGSDLGTAGAVGW